MSKKLIYCSVFAALTAVMSQISFPLPFTAVPVTLALLAVIMSGAVLGPKYGAISQTVYILLGIAGVPVFHNFQGGFHVITGVTGGYAVGYILAAFVTGLLYEKAKVISMILGVLSCYLFGTFWFMIYANVGFVQAVMQCVLPFLPGDALKICAALFLSARLKKRVTI